MWREPPHPAVRRHHPLRVWGLVRTAPNGQAQQVIIQFKRRGQHRKFKAIAVRTTEAIHGYLDTRVRVPARMRANSSALYGTWRA